MTTGIKMTNHVINIFSCTKSLLTNFKCMFVELNTIKINGTDHRVRDESNIVWQNKTKHKHWLIETTFSEIVFNLIVWTLNFYNRSSPTHRSKFIRNPFYNIDQIIPTKIVGVDKMAIITFRYTMPAYLVF